MAILVHGPVDPDPDAAISYDRFQEVAGGLRTMPPGLIAHIAIAWEEGFQVMGIWESHDAEQAAHSAPRVTELRNKMGLPPLEVSAPVQVHNVRTRDFTMRGRSPEVESEVHTTRTNPRFHHVALSVADLDACVAWYEDKLGFLGFREIRRVDPVPGADGLRMAIVGAGSLLVEFLEQPGSVESGRAFVPFRRAADIRGQAQLGFVVDDAEAVAQVLRSKGIEVEDHPRPGYPLRRFFCDVEGNLFQMSSHWHEADGERQAQPGGGS